MKKVQIKYKSLSNNEISEIKKILIIQQKPFGDVLLNTGYFAELRRRFPKAQIDFLVQKPYAIILVDNQHLDNLIIMKKEKGFKYFIPYIKAIRKIRNIKYDLVIDQLRGTSSARIVLFSGAKYRLGHQLKPKIRLGIKFNRWNWLYNIGAPRGKVRYYSRFKFDLLEPLGIKETVHNVQYFVTEESHKYIRNWLEEKGLNNYELVIFSPGTPVKKKQWDLKYYAKLADMIQNRLAFKVILLWGPGEKEDSEFIKRNAKENIILAPSTTFNQAGALLNYTKVLICNDGGINHLAVSQETPSIAIFGAKSDPIKWVAWHKRIHTFLKDWDFKNLNDNRFNISPEMVFQKLIELLNNNEFKNINDITKSRHYIT
jgi:ADP-heptose:LPS heptosyltransferase